MPRAPTWPEDRGTGISVQGRLWDSTGRHSLDRAQPEKAGHLGRGWGSFWSLLRPSPPPGPNTRHLLGSNCLRTERQKEIEQVINRFILKLKDFKVEVGRGKIFNDRMLLIITYKVFYRYHLVMVSKSALAIRGG